MSELAELLTRVEAATEGEFSLDDAIATVLDDWTHHTEAFDQHSQVEHHDTHDDYSFSIDASLELVKRKLGAHWCWELKEGIGFRCILWMLETDYDDRAVPTGHSAASAPLAILAALLRAKMEESHV